MAVSCSSVLARLRREPLPDHCALAQQVDQLCHDRNHRWRDRLLTPLVTLRLMLLQVLHGNTAITHLRQLSGLKEYDLMNKPRSEYKPPENSVENA